MSPSDGRGAAGQTNGGPMNSFYFLLGDLFSGVSGSIFKRLKHLFFNDMTCALMLLPDPTGPLAAGAVACLPREGWHGQQ